MREIRTSGSEGGGAETNQLSLPLSKDGVLLRYRFTYPSAYDAGPLPSVERESRAVLAAKLRHDFRTRGPRWSVEGRGEAPLCLAGCAVAMGEGAGPRRAPSIEPNARLGSECELTPDHRGCPRDIGINHARGGRWPAQSPRTPRQTTKDPAIGEPCARSRPQALPVHPWSRLKALAAAAPIRRCADCPPRTCRSGDRPRSRRRSSGLR
jgi:hypothetical protein